MDTRTYALACQAFGVKRDVHVIDLTNDEPLTAKAPRAAKGFVKTVIDLVTGADDEEFGPDNIGEFIYTNTQETAINVEEFGPDNIGEIESVSECGCDSDCYPDDILYCDCPCHPENKEKEYSDDY